MSDGKQKRTLWAARKRHTPPMCRVNQTLEPNRNSHTHANDMGVAATEVMYDTVGVYERPSRLVESCV
jgi:hypothetical protein